uniref:NADH dehydrogenase subunit 6 n=1 Tax=Phymata americana TaxID=1347736 RepID=A0A342CF70_9HEMI|nr:NADH dehydrogenase subunit 6 [Phymata americana]AGO27997.1 NADH dehydrogenase subunit 6 [Phymata americana]
MMTMMISSMIMSLIFTTLKHPLSMGLMLIMQTIMVAIMTGLSLNMFWFSYVLLMMMLSGALVLFIYMASVASNEKFKTPWTTILITMPIWATASMYYTLMDQMESSKIWSTKMISSSSSEIYPNLLSLFNNLNLIITIFLAMYLFLTMIVVTFVVNVTEGPLRSKS